MSQLSTNLADAETQVREAIRVKWEGFADSGKSYGRERYSDDLNKYLSLVSIKDAANDNKTVIRAAFVKFTGFEALEDDSSVCRTPYRLHYEIEVLYQFEDTRRDGTNSTDGFNRLLMTAANGFEKDDDLGIENLEHSRLSTSEEASVTEFDKVLVHRTTLSIHCDVYKF
jgi:hypothetical protein